MARGVFAAILLALIVSTPAHTRGASDCSEYTLSDYRLPNGYPFDVHRIVTLFRFHRDGEALRELDAARATVRGPWRWRLPSDARTEVAARLDALHECLTTTSAPALARIAVRVFGSRYDTGVKRAPRSGARVLVEGVKIGTTGPDGMLIARVPSGRVQVEAEDPITEWGSADVQLAPGESKSIRITLSDGKEVSEPTKLTLVEAVDDILRVTSRSLSLKFMRDGHFVPVAEVEEVDVLDAHGSHRTDLREHFRVVDGAIIAAEPRRVLEALRPHFEQTIRLHVHAMAGPDEMHDGQVAFRVGQSPLTVTLAAPPSNPGLTVSNVEVGVSTLHGIAVQRVSDSNGRFLIESFPHGTVAFECVVQSGGRYYYGNATLPHTGPRSVTLVLRHVDDLKAGVPALRN